MQKGGSISMANGYYNDYEDRLLGENTETKYEEDPRTEREINAEEYYPLPAAIRSRTLKWAVLSLVAGILSILLSLLPYIGFVMTLVAVVMTLISRRNLGYFDRYSTVGLITAIIGAVCSVFALVAKSLGLFF
jgi:hypothetical protein